jgi:uncharacterized protein (DUF39 family)
MANTVTQQSISGGASDKIVVRHIHIVSDGTEEADLVVYDNSTLIADVNAGSLLEVAAYGSDCVVRLEWDQTTDAPIISMNPSSGTKVCFREFGGRANPGAAGATGDILLSTANLDAGDEVSIFLTIKQK